MINKVLGDLTMFATGGGSIWIMFKDALPWGLSILVAATLVILQIRRMKESKAARRKEDAEAEYFELKNGILKKQLEERDENIKSD